MSPQWFVIGMLIFYGLHSGSLTPTHLLLLVLFVSLSAAYLLYHYQSFLLYQPRISTFITPNDNPPLYRHPLEHDCPYEDIFLVTPDGVKLHCWMIRAKDKEERKRRSTLLFFHANAGNIGFRLDNLSALYHHYNMNILIVDYRGYGHSTGTPNEEGMLIDAETAYQYLISRNDIDRGKIFVFGRSLGGAVAIALAHKHNGKNKDDNNKNNDGKNNDNNDNNNDSAVTPSSPPNNSYIAGVILENTFSSISDLADHLFPYLSPLKSILLTLKWSSIDRISSLTHPILFLCGQQDEIVPHSHMLRLYQSAVHSVRRVKYVVENGLHNNTWQLGGEEYKKVWNQFVREESGKVKGGEKLEEQGVVEGDGKWRVEKIMVHEGGEEGEGEMEEEEQKEKLSSLLSSGSKRDDVILGTKPLGSM